MELRAESVELRQKTRSEVRGRQGAEQGARTEDRGQKAAKWSEIRGRQEARSGERRAGI